MDMPTAIGRVLDDQDLSREEMLEVMNLIMTGEATDAQIGGFLVGLRAKGETVDDMLADDCPGVAEALRGMGFIELAVAAGDSDQKWHAFPQLK